MLDELESHSCFDHHYITHVHRHGVNLNQCKTRSHLEYLHLQILSIVTAAQLRRIFERRTNFDLRRLLNGAESFLSSLLDRLEFDIAMSTSSLQCLRLDPSLRKRAAEALLPSSKMKDILYIILVAEGKVITLIRPRKHSIHPAGFVNAYISFLRREGGDGAAEHAERSSATMSESGNPGDVPVTSNPTPTQRSIVPPYAACTQSGIALVCISGGGEFDSVRVWCDTVTGRLEKEGILDAIADSCSSGKTQYSVADLGIPGLRHFVYKSRSQVQITAPIFEDPYDNLEDHRRLITLYQTLHDAIHAKSGQEGTLKLQYIRTEKESVMGWITQPFEVYIALSPRLPKTAAVGAANAVARWVKKEEGRLFLRDAPATSIVTHMRKGFLSPRISSGFTMFGQSEKTNLVDSERRVKCTLAAFAREPTKFDKVTAGHARHLSRNSSSIFSMFFNSLGSASRLCAAIPPLTRSVVNRALSRPVPPPRGINDLFSTQALINTPHTAESITTPTEFLKAIGRSVETKVTLEKWEELWKLSGHELKKSGLAVRDRRYILWCMEKYRNGLPIESFAHEPKPKKTIRGWGPAVQNGKRIRSRKMKNKK
ncbi:hypothetical protein D9615_002841 [Tricholomella constricta]|uniref:Vacuolar fusion protein MON1 n=1 Tax=Tricholomella constricta TaxID=117010 RepID=A0A8H5M608_9AGAR|nr:hypothetical protein D9615_002841 [Tricholomella constricta]